MTTTTSYGVSLTIDYEVAAWIKTPEERLAFFRSFKILPGGRANYMNPYDRRQLRRKRRAAARAVRGERRYQR